MDNCIFCESELHTKTWYDIEDSSYWDIYCTTCRKYYITREAWINFSTSPYKKESTKISAYTRKQHVLKKSVYIMDFDFKTIPEQRKEKYISFDEIIQEFPKTISERLDQSLFLLSKESEYTGAPINITLSRDYPIFHPDSQEQVATKFILRELLRDNYIIANNGENHLLSNWHEKSQITITAKGWDRIIELESTNKNSKKVFVAMWFSDEMKEIFNNYIQPAVAEAKEGHDALHIGIKHHNNDITDEIMAEIKTSKFIIADLTGDRGGVYYEAGYALGRGLPVIFTCKEDWFKKSALLKVQHSKEDEKDYQTSTIHFDIDHMNILKWKDGEDFKKQLIDRIRYTID